MMRAFLFVTAVLIVGIAVYVHQPWLYGVAAAVLAGVLGVLGRQFWTAYRQDEGGADRAGAASADADDEDLGVMDVRPQEEAASPEPATPDDRSSSDEDPSTDPEEAGAAARAVAESMGDEEAHTDWAEEIGTADSPSSDEAEATSGPVYSEDQPVLAPFLESLRASIGAQSVCLLVQEEVALEYRIEALASVQPDVKHEGTFQTQEPLLTATMSRKDLTVRSLDEDGRRELGYYGTVPAVTQAAMAPVSRPDTSSTVFLMADATSEVDLGSSEARSLIEHFAETVALLLDAQKAGGDYDIQVAPKADTESPASDEALSEPSSPDPEESVEPDRENEEPRPRREIIAEEMEAADAASDDLALVLVHLNRAESIARQGEEAVTTTERHLRSRLEDLAPGRRVERFGELTYGIFVRSGVDEVEGWAADLQDRMAQETGMLEGGVSVGVAVRDVRHDAEDLRADATDALLEAYETGTCTIIA